MRSPHHPPRTSNQKTARNLTKHPHHPATLNALPQSCSPEEKRLLLNLKLGHKLKPSLRSHPKPRSSKQTLVSQSATSMASYLRTRRRVPDLELISVFTWVGSFKGFSGGFRPLFHTSVPVSTSQILTKVSSDELRMRVPSGENATWFKVESLGFRV